MELRIDLPDFVLAEGASASTKAIEDAMKLAIAESAAMYAKEVEAETAGVQTVKVTPKAQDGGVTIFTIVATAFVTGLTAELGKQAAQEIADRARKLLRHKNGKLIEEAASATARD